MGQWVKCSERLPEAYRQVWADHKYTCARIWYTGVRTGWATAAVWLNGAPTMWYDDDDAPPKPPSETAPTYEPDTRPGTCSPWHCRDCGREMWIVINGDARINGKAVLPGNARRPTLVQCPHCGEWNEWRRYE